MMTDYTPIDCGLHSEYELAILNGKRVRISWREPQGQLHTEVLKPRDLETRNHEEFLIADNSKGQQRKLRRDYIEAAVAV
jgi:Rho-binding antiterminator